MFLDNASNWPHKGLNLKNEKKFCQGTHPPSFKSIGPAIKKRATDDDNGRRRTSGHGNELIRETGSGSRKKGIGRPRSACTVDNKDRVEDLIQSQENDLGSHKSQREITREINVSRRSVNRLATSRQVGVFLP